MQEPTKLLNSDNKINSRIYCLQDQIKNGNLYNLLQKLRNNTQSMVDVQTKKIKSIRRKKLIQERKTYSKIIYLDALKPGDAVPRIFSQTKPLNTGNKFLDQKQKCRLLFSDRAFQKKPNIVSGIFRKRLETQSKQEKAEWMCRKFSQFDRICTEQTGPMRIYMNKRYEMELGNIKKKPIYISKISNSKNLFSTFQSDNLGLQQQMKKSLSTNAYSFKFKTQPSLQASFSFNQLQKIKHKLSKNNTLKKKQNKQENRMPIFYNNQN